MNPSLEKRCVNEGLAEEMGPSPLWFKNHLWLLQCSSCVAALFTHFFLKLICQAIPYFSLADFKQ